MNNSDMPAMPIIDNDQSFPLDMERYGSKSINETFATGLTKREMMAMHALNGLMVAYDSDDVAMSGGSLVRDAVWYADALLAELERTKCQS